MFAQLLPSCLFEWIHAGLFSASWWFCIKSVICIHMCRSLCDFCVRRWLWRVYFATEFAIVLLLSCLALKSVINLPLNTTETLCRCWPGCPWAPNFTGHLDFSCCKTRDRKPFHHSKNLSHEDLFPWKTLVFSPRGNGGGEVRLSLHP